MTVVMITPRLIKVQRKVLQLMKPSEFTHVVPSARKVHAWR
jgi:hypothetical protein